VIFLKRLYLTVLVIYTKVQKFIWINLLNAHNAQMSGHILTEYTFF
jgi:hypothetical protein